MPKASSRGRGSYTVESENRKKGSQKSHTKCTKRRSIIGRLRIFEGTQILKVAVFVAASGCGRVFQVPNI